MKEEDEDVMSGMLPFSGAAPPERSMKHFIPTRHRSHDEEDDDALSTPEISSCTSKGKSREE